MRPQVGFSVQRAVLGLAEQHEVLGAIVGLVLVDVVHLVFRRNLSVDAAPHLSVKPDDRLIVSAAPQVPRASAPLNAAITQTFIPPLSWFIRTKPTPATNTGWSAVATIERPSLNDIWNTSACRRVMADARTRRAPRGVATMSPCLTSRIGRAVPSPIVTIVSPTRHHAASCCGPRSRSGSSAEYVVAMAPFGHVSRRRDGS
jgi:hypothetical protein